MSRLRFRAWDADAEQFVYSFEKDDLYFWEFKDGKLRAFAIVETAGTIDEPPGFEAVELEKPEQSTDLRDKNGVEIFEGDIIKDDIEGLRDVVTWKENKYILEPLGDDCIYWEKSEVIGNVCENPELKQKTKKGVPHDTPLLISAVAV